MKNAACQFGEGSAKRNYSAARKGYTTTPAGRTGRASIGYGDRPRVLWDANDEGTVDTAPCRWRRAVLRLHVTTMMQLFSTDGRRRRGPTDNRECRFGGAQTVSAKCQCQCRDVGRGFM